MHRLLAQDGEGGEVESSAEFTLTPEKALERLSTYQLPDPALWPVKMVQGAVARGASEVSIVLEKSRVHVRKQGGRPIAAADLLRQMCSGSAPQERSDRH